MLLLRLARTLALPPEERGSTLHEGRRKGTFQAWRDPRGIVAPSLAVLVGSEGIQPNSRGGNGPVIEYTKPEISTFSEEELAASVEAQGLSF